MAITPGGRVGNAGPVGTPGGRQNWVDKVGGLPRYIRMVAHAMIRKGHPESQAIRLAVGIVRNWAEGKGDVSPKVRAAAAAAIAEWEAKRARSHVDMSSDVHDGSGSVLNPGVDIRELDLSSVATGDVSHDRDATDVDLAPGDYRPPYDWKHGYIPITPAAVRSKRKLGGKTGHARPPKGRKIAGVGKVTPGRRTASQVKAADDAARGRAVPATPTKADQKRAEGIAGRVGASNPDVAEGVAQQLAQARAEGRDTVTVRPLGKPVVVNLNSRQAGGPGPGMRTTSTSTGGHPVTRSEAATSRAEGTQDRARLAVESLLREARTPGLSETDRARKTAEAEKLAKKHKLDADALDEQVRQSMYEYRSGEGFVLKADGLTEADKVRAAGNHRRQAEVQRSRGNHEAAAHHEAEAAKYDPSSAKPATDEFSQRLKRRATLSRANAEAAGVRAKPDGTFNDTAGETLRKTWPVGQGVRAGVAGNDTNVVGEVVGHTDTGMIRVRYKNHRGEDTIGTFNPAQARKTNATPKVDARTNQQLGSGDSDLSKLSTSDLMAELGTFDTTTRDRFDSPRYKALEKERKRRVAEGMKSHPDRQGGFKPAGPGVQAMVLPVGAAGPKRRVADMTDAEVQTELAKLHGKSKADSTEADVQRYADLANARHDRLEAGTWSGKRPNGKTQRITAQGMDLLPERNAEARAATGSRVTPSQREQMLDRAVRGGQNRADAERTLDKTLREAGEGTLVPRLKHEGFVTNAGLPPDRDTRGLIVTGKPKDSTGGDLPASPTADQIGAASTSDLENRLRTIEAVNPSSPVARQIAAELNERHRVGRGGGGMDTSQRARVTQAEGGAVDRRAQEAAVARKDYANADGPVLAAEVARRNIMGAERATQKSDAQLRAALKAHDRASSSVTTELDRGAISPTTARKMTDDQLDAAVRRLMASGTYSGPGLKVLEDELNRRDKARAGKARGR